MKRIEIEPKQIAELLDSGLTKQQVADALGVNVKTIYNRVKLLGISVRDYQVEKRRQDSASGHYTVKQLAKKYRTNARASAKYLYRRGYEPRYADESKRDPNLRQKRFIGCMLKSKPCAGMTVVKNSIVFANRLQITFGRDCTKIVAGNDTEFHPMGAIHTSIGDCTVHIERAVGATVTIRVGANKLLFSYDKQWSVEAVRYTR